MSRISTASLDFYSYKISSISSYLIPLPSSIPRLRNQCQLQKFLQDIIYNSPSEVSVDVDFINTTIGNSNFDAGYRTAKRLVDI